jgi:hypothetical protein
MTTPLERIADWYEALTPETLPSIGEHYAEQAYFKDPFHEFVGRDRLLQVYRRMFDQLGSPRFEIDHRFQGAQEGMLIWRFHFALRGRDWCIPGSSHLRFGADGTVTGHRDYWDAGEHVYEHVPVLRAVLRLIKSRVA